MTGIGGVSRGGNLWYASQGGRLDKADAQVEQDPAQKREEEDDFALPEAICHDAPKRGAAEFDEVPNAHQQPALAGRHPQLFVVHGQERVKRAIGRVKEKIEHLGNEQVIVYLHTVFLYPVYFLLGDGGGLRGGGGFVGGGLRFPADAVEGVGKHVLSLLLLFIVR